MFTSIFRNERNEISRNVILFGYNVIFMLSPEETKDKQNWFVCCSYLVIRMQFYTMPVWKTTL